MNVTVNQFGFVWGECLVERTCSQEKPFFQIIRVFTPSGEVVEIVMQKRKNTVNRSKTTVLPKRLKKKGKRK